MKKILSAVIYCTFLLPLFSQWSNKSFTYDGSTRQYRVYLPSNYNQSSPASMVMTLHGMGDNMTNFSTIGMNFIADTANIIVVVPQALSDPYAGTTWNSGAGYMGYFPNSSVNDIGFLNSLLDTIQNNYSINANRVYCLGFSMGGFMTQRLACELTGRFTAVASVAGTIGQNINSCAPSKSIPLAHFHGTLDQTVGYTSNQYGINVDSLINMWVGLNSCDTSGLSSTFPDIASDGYTVDHFIYPNGNEGSEVELFRVNGANHVWLTYGNDIDYSVEIWNFFNKHKISLTAGLKTFNLSNTIQIFPNPTSEKLFVKIQENMNFDYIITQQNGKILLSGYTDVEHPIEINSLSKGIYFISCNSKDNKRYVQKFVIE